MDGGSQPGSGNSATGIGASLQEDPTGQQQAEFFEKAHLADLINELGTHANNGLTSDEAAHRLQEDGPNELEKSKRPGFFTLFLLQLTNMIIVLLIIAAVASFAVNSMLSGIAILVIVILNAGIAAATENQAGNALEALSKMSQPEAAVIRNGNEDMIPSSNIVKGDIVVLGVGDVFPADIRLIETHDLKVDEMPLTGESDDVSKSARPRSQDSTKLTPENMGFSGCSVTSGSANGVVVATGMRTRVGKIAALLASTDKGGRKCFGLLPDLSANQTPLQASLQRLGMLIGVLAIFVCVVVFIVGILLGTTDPNDPDMPSWVYMILIAITLTVAAIPEGIPLCVTISLSTGCYDMVSRHVLVRRISAVETLGSASVICSDKTGTLTEGKMTAVKMWAGGMDYSISGIGFDPTSGTVMRADGSEAPEGGDPSVRSTLLVAVLCSNARVEQESDENGAVRWVPNGNSSEVPLVVAGQKIGIRSQDLQEQYPRVMEVPFSSSRKMMLTICGVSVQRSFLGSGGVEMMSSGETAIACVKGAPNFVIDACSAWIGSSGAIEHFGAAARSEALRTIDDLSSQALRVLAVAVRPMPEVPEDMSEWEADTKMAHCCKDLILLGLVASIDKAREGVRESVQAAHEGNIHVMMITGDYSKTAAAIAKNIGILQSEEDTAIDCSVLRPDGHYIGRSEMDALVANACVFARAKPEDKLEIVQSLRRQGRVSAMTGDGVNDAPALKAADIGVAMGIQGTEVAKGASDMILTDDNFVSIVGAVEKGRVIYAGIQKFVAFIMSVHIAEVLQIFGCIVVSIPVMRSPIQILYLILVTDLAPSVALGMEPGQEGIMKDKPRPKDQPILLGWMWRSVVVNSVILTAVIMSVYIWALHYFIAELNDEEITRRVRREGEKGFVAYGLMKARTTAFISLVWSENVRAYTSRSFDQPVWKDTFANKYMQRAIGIAEAALFLAVFLPGLSHVLRLRGDLIGWQGWLGAFVGAMACLMLCELYKLGIRLHNHFLEVRQKRKKLESGSSLEPQPASTDGSDSSPEQE